jgi:hypothetical protein
VVFGLTVLACRTRLPVYAGFWLSKPWLDQEVKAALAMNARSRTWMSRNGVKVVMPLMRVSSSRRLGAYLFSDDHEVAVSPEDVVIFLPLGGAFVFRDDGQFPTVGPNGEWTGPGGSGRVRRMSANWFLVEPDRNGD